MYPTVEVRWFYHGPIPPPVEAWFERRPGNVERQPSRVDHYLRLSDSDELNIKLRQGRIEVKQRTAPPRVTQFHKHVAGALEAWRKWSFELAGRAEGRSRSLSPSSAWIAVRKARRLRTYQVTGGLDLAAQPTPETPDRGCELELTQVDVMGQTWWTMAFEAFGPEASIQENLLLVAKWVFGNDEPPRLRANASHGYAAWLDKFTHREA
jgi:hypothetical protein